MIDSRTRARNALLGLAIGDAISWPAMFHRSWLLPAWTRRHRREIDAQREEVGVTRVPTPFSANQRPDNFDLYPTDDTEWAAWTMLSLLRHDCIVEDDWVTEEWTALSRGQESIRGPISTLAALANFRKGLRPPTTGNDNPHYFDDAAMCRSIPIGIAYAGRPEDAAKAAAVDASVTNAQDGVFVASSVAAAISVACKGATSEATITAAINALPEDSWSRRIASHALERVEVGVSLLSMLPSLHHILNVEYSDGCAGPETLALVLAIVSTTDRNVEQAITAAASFAKGADALPAIVGAITGALAQDALPREPWSPLRTLRGICLPSLQGTDFLLLTDGFICGCGSLSGT